MTYEGNWLTECESTVLEAVLVDAGSANEAAAGSGGNNSNDKNNATTMSIVLDRTVLHAQGGGQPTDTGKLMVQRRPTADSAESAGLMGQTVVVTVSKVLIDRTTGVTRHTGNVVVVDAATGDDDDDDDADPNTNNNKQVGAAQQQLLRRIPKVGDSVRVLVDQDKRRILSECHTAGHVVDSAMVRCGLMLTPNKAYHFLEGPYVEYNGTIPDSERESVLSDLQTAFSSLVAENIDTEIALLSLDDADAVCNSRQQKNVLFDMNVFCDPRTQQVRVVTVAGYPCPCGGTHVRSTGDLARNQWGITGIKSKKGVVRVKYGQGVVL